MEYYFYLRSFIEKQKLQLSTLVREIVSKCQYVTLMDFSMCSCAVESNTLQLHGLTTHQAPQSMGILQARILEWFDMPSSRDLPDQGWNPGLLYFRETLLSEPTAPDKMSLDVYRCVICLLLFTVTVFCFVLLFPQLTRQSSFYSPESNLECKFFLKEKKKKHTHTHKRNFYLKQQLKFCPIQTFCQWSIITLSQDMKL